MFVRTARETDVSDIAHICATGWRDAASGESALDETVALVETRVDEKGLARDVQRTDGDHGWVVAVEDDTVVAAGGGRLTDDASGEVFSLHTHPEVHRAEAGNAVLRTLTAQQVVAGARQQWAWCPDGDDEMLSFYREQGFEVVASVGTDDAPESLRLVRRI
ncbi:GNAT family N-acetyltransferase [Haloferax sp. MBLA0076]|uniref:GNAT family N-acetyltransferase n=1 Tax=Haloferax litoreum TaxID=2666140 RepID=A0A6A8GFK0_9EURY|nr:MULTISPECIES: GNAT family N-acetyltransferase [Haloferax]KAB1193150.1 GNAT family N-acetyltransferase [Haloferax sp. CBA1148]MRX21646.1 GNAT family N-acetyltransferase [Haloferax litoreum]